MPAPEDFARAAEALAGARFRLHGRDRSTGLDCVGLVGLALAEREADLRRAAAKRGYSRARAAKRSVEMDSSTLDAAGPRAATMTVLELPPRESARSFVSAELR